MEKLKFDLDKIGNTLNKILISSVFFSEFTLLDRKMQKISTPTISIEYNYTFVSKEKNRWLFIRIQDFFSHQKVIIWVNKLNNKQPVNIDVQSYFLIFLNKKSILKKMILKARSEVELETGMKNIVYYIEDNSDQMMKDIFNGKDWIDMKFDWGDYK